MWNCVIIFPFAEVNRCVQFFCDAVLLLQYQSFYQFEIKLNGIYSVIAKDSCDKVCTKYIENWISGEKKKNFPIRIKSIWNDLAQLTEAVCTVYYLNLRFFSLTNNMTKFSLWPCDCCHKNNQKLQTMEQKNVCNSRLFLGF